MPDAWQSVKLEDIFPGMKQGIGNLHKETSELLSRSQKVLDQLQLKQNALSQMAETTNTLLNALAESGFYMLALPPASGGIVGRITSAENAPPAESYSAGLVIAVVAPDLPSAAEKYAKLMQILTTGF